MYQNSSTTRIFMRVVDWPGSTHQIVRVGTIKKFKMSSSRSNRGAETRLRIIRAAADLFHKQGAGATSPDQVIEASRTGKGQFYHYFKSKEGLVHAVLQTYLVEIKNGASQVNYE